MKVFKLKAKYMNLLGTKQFDNFTQCPGLRADAKFAKLDLQTTVVANTFSFKVEAAVFILVHVCPSPLC